MRQRQNLMPLFWIEIFLSCQSLRVKRNPYPELAFVNTEVKDNNCFFYEL